MGVQEDIVNNEDRARINIKNRTDTQRVKVESLSFDQLNSSEGDDLDFIKGLMDSPKITETPNKSDSSVPKKKGKDIDEENLPPNPVEFLRQYPRSLESLVKQYYPPKEVDKYVNSGLIQRSRGKFYI